MTPPLLPRAPARTRRSPMTPPPPLLPRAPARTRQTTAHKALRPAPLGADSVQRLQELQARASPAAESSQRRCRPSVPVGRAAPRPRPSPATAEPSQQGSRAAQQAPPFLAFFLQLLQSCCSCIGLACTHITLRTSGSLSCLRFLLLHPPHHAPPPSRGPQLPAVVVAMACSPGWHL